MNYYPPVRRFVYQFIVAMLLIITSAVVVNNSLWAASFDANKVAISDMQAFEMSKPKVSENDSLEMQMSAYGQSYTFHLIENKRLIRKARSSLSIGEQVLYAGSIEGVENSWVRLSKVDNEYIGAFFDGTELFLVDSAIEAANLASSSEIGDEVKATDMLSVVFKASSISNIGQCSLDSTSSSGTFEYSDLLGSIDTKAVALAVGATKEIEITVVADTEYVTANGGDTTGNILAQMNVVDGIFSEQLGLQMSVTNVVQLASNGPLTSTNSNTLIVDFRQYVVDEIGNQGLTHLFTGKELDGNTVGIAYVGGVCGSFGVGVTQARGVSSVVALIAAHEFGHNFTSPHDNESGSACSGTSGNFLMNPSINGNDQFSDCSLSIIQPVINSASCIVDITPVEGIPPIITSNGNLNATTNTGYFYDENNQIEADGSETITYTLDYGPEGMTVSENGFVAWTPSNLQEGINSIQVTASNDYGNDTQSFDIEVVSPPNNSVINFNQNALDSYGGSQDITGTVEIEDGGASLYMQGNRWQYISMPYDVTSETVIEFDLKATSKGEIHGIGMDDNLALSEERLFNLYGTQSYGIETYQYSGSGDFEHFVIPVGEYFTGAMSNIYFVMDHDVNAPTGVSAFRNVQVYEYGDEPLITAPSFTSSPILTATVGVAYQYDEDGNVDTVSSEVVSYGLIGPDGMTLMTDGLISWTPSPDQEGVHSVQVSASNSAGTTVQNFDITVSSPVIDDYLNFNENSVLTYSGGSGRQDVEGIVSIEDGGATLHIEGNRWKRVEYELTISEDTVIEFDFKSSSQGEIHGLGLDNDLVENSFRLFNLYGTQTGFGNRTYTYTDVGNYQHFEIPVGQFYQGEVSNIFFAMDHDVTNPTGNSFFKNLKIKE